MSSSQISDRLIETLGASGLWSLKTLSKILNRKTLRNLGRYAGLLAGKVVARREYETVRAQLSFAQKSSAPLRNVTPEGLYRGVFKHIGESVAEILILEQLLKLSSPESAQPTLYPGFMHISQEGRELCVDLINSGKPYLSISAHVGNFELLAAYHIRSGIKASIVGRAPNFGFLHNWVQQLRTDYGAESLMRPDEFTSSRAVSVALLNAFKHDRCLAVLLDQDTNLESEFAPYFGLDAGFPAAPVRLAVRKNARIVTSFLVREGLFSYRVLSEEIEYNPESKSAARDVLTVYSKRLERLVEQYPEQYLWFHRRWRRRPGVDYEREPEKLRGTKEYQRWIMEQEPVC